MRKVNDKGFSAVELVIVILVFILIGAVGYLVYKDRHTTVPKVVAVTKTTGSKSSSNTVAKATNTSSKGNFAIPEWGLIGNYTGPLTIKYVVDTSSVKTAYFTSSELTTADSSQGCGIDVSNTDPTNGQTYHFGGGGTIGRYLATDIFPTEGPPAETVQSFIKNGGTAIYAKVGQYYYIYTPMQGPCSSNPQAQQVQQQTIKAVEDLTKSLASTQ
jgi:hypothetical protein